MGYSDSFLIHYLFYYKMRLQSKQIIWQSKLPVFSPVLSECSKNLLAQAQSLTTRAVKTWGPTEIFLIDAYWGMPHFDEMRQLNIELRQVAYIREIFMMQAGEKLWYARSVTPQSFLHSKLRLLPYLHTRPLANLVFVGSQFKRSVFEYAAIHPHHSNYARLWEGIEEQVQHLPARRSQFRLQKNALLLTEIFLPKLLQRLDSCR